MYPKLTKSLLIATLLAGSSVTQFSYATDASINMPVTSLKYVDSGAGPLKISPAFGDPSKGAHSTFVKMPAGFVSKPHTHTADYYAVVISGVVANAATAEEPNVELAPGSYWLQKGKAVHVTKCLSTNECIVFITQPAKFDYLATGTGGAEKE